MMNIKTEVTHKIKNDSNKYSVQNKKVIIKYIFLKKDELD